MDFLKVASRTDLAAEDTSQAAPRATVHLIAALSRTTFCGQIAVQHVAHAGTDRVVSCAPCLSAARHERESPADNTSLTEPASRTLRHVSGPDYSGIERRSRPRFIHHAVPTTTSNGEETMKQYTNVFRPNETTIHVLFDGDIATACGAISTPELTSAPQGKAVSCDACTKAILNQQRASDHRVAVELTQAILAPVHHRDALTEVRDIIDNCNSRMVGDGSGEREYILSADDIAKLRGLRDAFLAESIIGAQKVVNDADLLDQLRQVCGYVENGSSEYVTIGQDDATREWTISIGDSYARNMGKARRYNGTSFHQAIRNAAVKEIEVEVEEPGEAASLAQPRAATLFHAGGAIPAQPVVSHDAVVEANRKLLLDRSNVGIEKYGVTLEQSGLSVREFAQHALEESLDHANYLQAIIMTLDNQQQKQ